MQNKTIRGVLGTGVSTAIRGWLFKMGGGFSGVMTSVIREIGTARLDFARNTL